MNFLYAGDSPVGGSANYLLAVLRFMRARFVHIPPDKSLRPGVLARRFDAIVLSDYPRSRLARSAERAMAQQIARGTGLLMIGGWASFSGAFGGWRGSEIEELLPVRCLPGDDRVNFPSGALLVAKRKHPLVPAAPLRNPPMVCGLNCLMVKSGSRVLIAARRLRARGERVSLERREYPLLVVGPEGGPRTAALSTDVAPHWCGGLVDWGSRRLELPLQDGVRVEVGNAYARFLSSLLAWVAGGRP